MQDVREWVLGLLCKFRICDSVIVEKPLSESRFTIKHGLSMTGINERDFSQIYVKYCLPCVFPGRPMTSA